MSLEFFDGLSPYGSLSDMIGRWAISDFAERELVSEPLFPTGRAIEIDPSLTARANFIFEIANPSPVIIAGCFFMGVGTIGNRRIRLFSFYNAADELLGGLRADSDNGIYVVDSDGSVIGSVGSVPTTETHYEIRMLFSDDEEVGSVEVRVNEEVAYTFTGVTSTRADQNCAKIGSTGHGGGAINTNWISRIGHYHVLVPDATPTGDFLGIAQIGYLRPTTTIVGEWNPDSGDNFSRVDESEADGDTSYVGAAVVNSRDLYRVEDLVAIDPNIYAINVHSIQRLESAGSRNLRHLVGQEGDYDYIYEGLELAAGEDHTIISTSYESRATLILENPLTDTDWTHDDINNLVAGMELNP